MSDLNLAFKLQKHSENKDFVENPYIPIPTLTYTTKPLPKTGQIYLKTPPQSMTIARYFDVKTGAKQN